MSTYFTIKNKTYIRCGDTYYCITHLSHRQLTCLDITEETYNLNYHLYIKDKLDTENAIWKNSAPKIKRVSIN